MEARQHEVIRSNRIKRTSRGFVWQWGLLFANCPPKRQLRHHSGTNPSKSISFFSPLQPREGKDPRDPCLLMDHFLPFNGSFLDHFLPFDGPFLQVAARDGKDPREFCINSKRFLGDADGNLTGIETVPFQIPNPFLNPQIRF